MKQKFLSRKFLLTLIGDILGILTMLVGQTTATTIIGAVAVIVINVVYCIVEGTIDAKSVSQITDAVEDIVDELGGDDKTIEVIDKVGDALEGFVEKEGTYLHDTSK